ncbi:MAG: hypothetical protein NE327_08490 [Lentisphaeraceae bacterium]|nr:hypothetical protein [Lentisphaeraceae bacterium]
MVKLPKIFYKTLILSLLILASCNEKAKAFISCLECDKEFKFKSGAEYCEDCINPDEIPKDLEKLPNFIDDHVLPDE